METDNIKNNDSIFQTWGVGNNYISMIQNKIMIFGVAKLENVPD